MSAQPTGLEHHRVRASAPSSVVDGRVQWSPAKSIWFLGMASGAGVGGLVTFNWHAFGLFLAATGIVLLFGHSLGSHRKLVHDSFQCPKWLEYTLVYLGVQVGLAGPLGILRQHELRDYAQRLPTCHDYLRHGQPFWIDAWWQLNCELRLMHPPDIRIEERIAGDRFYRFLERTWMAQHIPWVVLFYCWGGWSFVFWGVCARVTAGVFGHWIIGYLAHNEGGMHYEVRGAAVQGRNIRFAALLTMGECWHNNHHAFPGSARLGLFPGEWDPGWQMLLLLKRIGLVTRLRLPHHLPERPELHALGVSCAAAARGVSEVAVTDGAPLIDRLSQLVRLCRRSYSDAQSGRVLIEWPGAFLTERCLRRLTGSTPVLRVSPVTRRLTLRIAGARVIGLPALCLALAARHPLARAVALALMPVAVLAERLRPIEA